MYGAMFCLRGKQPLTILIWNGRRNMDLILSGRLECRLALRAKTEGTLETEGQTKRKRKSPEPEGRTRLFIPRVPDQD